MNKNKARFEGNEGQEFALKNLIQVVVDSVNWKTLYRDPAKGDYWKKFSPQSELQGGGPPVFEKISKDEAKSEFNIELA